MGRVLVLGAGALGSLVGALLAEAGHDVLLVGRARHVEAVEREGLRVVGGAYGPDRNVRVRAAEVAPPRWGADLVVLAVKTQDVAAALDEHRAAFDAPGDVSPVVALQNGLAQDGVVVALVGPHRAVAAVAAVDASFVEPGVVSCDRRGSLLVGPATPSSADAAGRATRLLRDAVDTRWEPDVLSARWTKLLVNLGNVVPALTGLPLQATTRHPLLGRAHVRMIREGLAVARAEGVALASIPYASPWLLRTAGVLPEPWAARVMALRARGVLGRTPAYGSTWQSVVRGRPLETDWLNGEVVRRGAVGGVATPVNSAACALAERGLLLEPDEAARALVPA